MVEESVRYERRDFNARTISFYALGLVIVCVVSAVAIWLFEKELNRFFGYPGHASWTSSPVMIAPPPRLQTDPARELAAMRAEEDAILQNYGWVDRSNGVIRIPIDVAMQRLLERGLPVRQSPPPATPKPAP
ncbi:MAG: hypothetical protein P4L99_07665 [Chthoniobacter sp.]|nr:hypothetical protein [Chthoniobacter sp.]